MRREDERETLQNDWAWKIKRHWESRTEMEDKNRNKTQGQQPQRSDMPLENFYSWSILLVLSLQGKLTSLHGSPESPGVYLKASKSKLIAARISLLSGWNLTIPLLRWVTPIWSNIHLSSQSISVQVTKPAQTEKKMIQDRNRAGESSHPMRPFFSLSSTWIFCCGIMKEDRKTYDKAVCWSTSPVTQASAQIL